MTLVSMQVVYHVEIPLSVGLVCVCVCVCVRWAKGETQLKEQYLKDDVFCITLYYGDISILLSKYMNGQYQTNS